MEFAWSFLWWGSGPKKPRARRGNPLLGGKEHPPSIHHHSTSGTRARSPRGWGARVRANPLGGSSIPSSFPRPAPPLRALPRQPVRPVTSYGGVESAARASAQGKGKHDDLRGGSMAGGCDGRCCHADIFFGGPVAGPSSAGCSRGGFSGTRRAQHPRGNARSGSDHPGQPRQFPCTLRGAVGLSVLDDAHSLPVRVVATGTSGRLLLQRNTGPGCRTRCTDQPEPRRRPGRSPFFAAPFRARVALARSVRPSRGSPQWRATLRGGRPAFLVQVRGQEKLPARALQRRQALLHFPLRSRCGRRRKSVDRRKPGEKSMVREEQCQAGDRKLRQAQAAAAYASEVSLEGGDTRRPGAGPLHGEQSILVGVEGCGGLECRDFSALHGGSRVKVFPRIHCTHRSRRCDGFTGSPVRPRPPRGTD